MTTPRIKEMVEEFEEKIANKDFETWQLGKDWLRKALTEAHQAGYADGYKQGKYEQKN